MKRAKNHKKYLKLRQEFPFFIFQSYSYQIDAEGLKAEFVFNLAGKYSFKPTLKIPSREIYRFGKLSKEQVNTFVFHIGMVELISYWKAACPPQLIIRPHTLNQAQIAWWKNLYYHGLGEFFYLNGIEVAADDFMQIEAEGVPTEILNTPLLDSKVLVPVGGGKDSIVTLELLKSGDFGIIPFMLNPREASVRTLEIAGFSLQKSSVVERSLDPQLLELNQLGFLNGHTPFSALLAFVASLVAVASGTKYIALSNENSANQSTVPGSSVNHQYSKSFDFEKDFVDYAQKYLHPDLAYFSFLRPLNELQIARLFSGFPQHFHSFRSCNMGSKTDSWCGHCPKCLFTFSILSPFISPGELKIIFGRDLYADDSMLPVFDELTGEAAVKPFECVGTPEEVRAAVAKTKEGMREEEWPALLQYFQSYISPATFADLLNTYENQNYLPDGFARILREALGQKSEPAFKAFLGKLLDDGKKVLILGYGREGRSSYQLLRAWFPDLKLGIADRREEIEGLKQLKKDNRLSLHLGERYKNIVDKYNFILKSPGVSLRSFPPFEASKISSQTDLFLRFYRSQTIGITGTKGKSTTASLTAYLLKEQGLKTVLLGNIGVPAFDRVHQIDAETIVVFELSAHQLEYLQSSPHVAVLLNIFPEHLDYFQNFEKYRDAKLNIFKHQLAGDIVITEESMENKGLPPSFDMEYLPLKGAHNRKNITAALQAVSAFGVSEKKALSALAGFKPLPHRLEFVGEFGGMQFYNDSISTVPESTIAALETLQDVEVLFLGGFDRGIDYSGLVNYLLHHPVGKIFFMGKAGETMLKLLKDEKQAGGELRWVASLSEALKNMKENQSRRGVCLLSPAAASYDQFHNFEHRGDVFKDLVKKLFV